MSRKVIGGKQTQLAITANNLSVALGNYNPVNFHVNEIIDAFAGNL